ncbi:UNVERIFIED_ORG: hypothetical protein QOE_3928 [Clostridioides difficile F501]
MRADRAHGAGAAVPRHVADVCGAPATTAAAVRSAVSGDVSHMPTARVRFSAGVQRASPGGCAPVREAFLSNGRFRVIRVC